MKKERIIVVCPKCRKIHILERIGQKERYMLGESVKIEGYEEYFFTCMNKSCKFEFLVSFEPREIGPRFIDLVLKRGLEKNLWAIDRWVEGEIMIKRFRIMRKKNYHSLQKLDIAKEERIIIFFN